MNRRKIKYSSQHFMQAGCHIASCPPPPWLLVPLLPTPPAAPPPIRSLVAPACPLPCPSSSPVRLPPLVQPPAVCGIASCCAHGRLLSALRPLPLIAPAPLLIGPLSPLLCLRSGRWPHCPLVAPMPPIRQRLSGLLLSRCLLCCALSSCALIRSGRLSCGLSL
jgi:hypothetical protein